MLFIRPKKGGMKFKVIGTAMEEKKFHSPLVPK